VPLVMVVGLMGLAVGLIAVEGVVPDDVLEAMPLLFGTAADGSRALLAAVAGSMITVAGTVFSITIVSLTLASSQYTPRVLQSFMRDRLNQVVLGVFVGVFAYSLVVLRTVRGGDEDPFVPSLAVLFTLVLALVGLVFLIVFIHHTARSIQASYIITAVGRETLRSIDRLYPVLPDGDGGGVSGAPAGAGADGLDGGGSAGRRWWAVDADESGYLQEIDIQGLVGLACERDAVVRLEHGVGEFVVRGVPVACVLSVAAPSGEMASAVAEMFGVGRRRTPEQDVGFSIRQTVDIALRALSPSLNDTTTAVMCIDSLTEVLVRLAGREIPSSFCDDGGCVRVLADTPSFAWFVDESLDQIRGDAAGNAVVLGHLLRCLRTVAGCTGSASRLGVLRRHAEAVHEVVCRSVESPTERASLESGCRATLEATDGSGGGGGGRAGASAGV